MKVTYYGHACVLITLKTGTKILVDPFITDNPQAPLALKDITADYILATHGHNDHIDDLVPLAKRDKIPVVCIAEMADWLAQQGIQAHGMNIGGSYAFPFGHLKMVFAQHSSSFSKANGENIYLGEAAGFVLQADNQTLYIAGDTAYFSDMSLLKEDFDIDLALVPIGDNYTMGIKDAARCVAAVGAKKAIPIHYNTFPVIQQDPVKFQGMCSPEVAVILAPGATYSL